MRTISIDLTRFTSQGFGTVHGAAAEGLHSGEHIAVTDDEADTMEAEVLRANDGSADIRIFWNRILHRTS